MLEWWQALLLGLIPATLGGAIAFVTMLVHQDRTATTGRQAEERQAVRRQREAEIQPINEALTAFREFGSASHVDEIAKGMDKAWQENRDKFAEQHGTSLEVADEAYEELKAKWAGTPAGDKLFDVFRGMFVALPVCPTTEIRTALLAAYAQVVYPGSNPEAFAQLARLLENYVARVD